MIIYKIINKINKKVYIGQTCESLNRRFYRHKSHARQGTDTHLYRAIRKYGEENFTIEQIDTANSQEELDNKEIYWIKYYNSFKNGYNSKISKGKCGGDTLSKHKEKKKISLKISKAVSGGNNSRATKVIAKNIITKETIYFNSMSEAQKYFNLKNHNHIRRRCTGDVKKLFRNEWTFEYNLEGVETIENTHKVEVSRVD